MDSGGATERQVRTESVWMRLCFRLGLEGLAWSLRRLHCPVDGGALVLEVGSGGNPYARADVLLDAFEETQERQSTPLKADRPTILGFVENLPFRDHAFDFVIASHVLEHSAEPERFLLELQRVAKAGYIEVPDAFVERISPYGGHRLEITCRSGQLVIQKKPAAAVDQHLIELYRHRAMPFVEREAIRRHPFAFHVRYYWVGTIAYEILNPEVDAHWTPTVVGHDAGASGGLKQRARGWILTLIRWLGRPSARDRRSLDVAALLRCPACKGDNLSSTVEQIRCNQCGQSYPIRNGLPVMQFPRPSD